MRRKQSCAAVEGRRRDFDQGSRLKRPWLSQGTTI